MHQGAVKGGDINSCPPPPYKYIYISPAGIFLIQSVSFFVARSRGEICPARSYYSVRAPGFSFHDHDHLLFPFVVRASQTWHALISLAAGRSGHDELVDMRPCSDLELRETVETEAMELHDTVEIEALPLHDGRNLLEHRDRGDRLDELEWLDGRLDGLELDAS